MNTKEIYKNAKRWILSVLIATALAVTLLGILIGISTLNATEKSERELWRITDYSILQSVVTNDQFIFSGHKTDRSIDCDCVYAVNKSTGEITWSTEEIEKPYISGENPSNLSSVSSYIEMVAPAKGIVYISLIYDSGNTIKTTLVAVKSIDGELLWKVGGEVDSASFAQAILEDNQIFIIDEQGDLLAINSDTGKEVWRHNIYFHSDDNWLGYYKDTVFTFDRQRGQKIRAFDAETGQLIWESDQLGNGRGNVYIFDKTIYIASPPSDRNKLVTAIDLETGSRRWDLIFPDVSEFSISAGNKNENLFLSRKYEGGPDNFHKLAKLIVVDEFTGQVIWKFNENFSHGDFHCHVNGNIIYIGTEDGFVFSINMATGKVVWQTETNQYSIPFDVVGNDLIVLHEENYISVLDTKMGLQKWKLNLGIDKSWSVLGENVIGINNNTIFIAGNYSQKICAIDINTGHELWSWRHFLPERSKYEIQLVGDILYVDQWSNNGWYYFALKTNE